jgi:hypothetical protein
MAPLIRTTRVNHVNAVLEDFDASVAHFKQLYDAEFLLDLPRKEMHACLIAFGGVIFELFVPYEFLLNMRYGPHWLGLEYQADMNEVRQVIAARGIRIARDIGVAVHTHPKDCFGVAYEFYDKAFHDNEWALLDGQRMKPAVYWRDEHPLGLTGLKGITLVVADLGKGAEFLRGFMAAETLFEEDRPAIAARLLGLKVADATIELIQPTGAGVIKRHLDQFGEGIQATVFGVRSLDQARRYFQTKGAPLVAGTAPNSAAIPAEANRGLIFEFRE